MKSGKVTQISNAALWGLLILVTIITRFYNLENKPIHFDESINGWFVMQMKTLGFYRYDPNNYHGPLYFYLLQALESVMGRSLATLRTLPALFGVLTVALFSLRQLSSQALERGVGLLLLVSPAFLFFARSGIHEMPFVFFQIVFALGILRWVEKQDGKAIALGLIGLFGMVTLKETFAITIVCWLLALASLGPSSLRALFSRGILKSAWSSRLSLLALFLLFLFVALFTGFFKNLSGLADFVRAFMPWLKTGVHGQGHEKPFAYWLEVMWAAEPLALFGVVLALAGNFSSDKRLRLFSVFALSQLLIYSLIPYKTVWCVLTLVWGFYFVLVLQLLRLGTLRIFNRVLLLGLAVVALGVGVRSAYQSVFRSPMDLDHPYVYVNSTYDLQTLQNLLLSTLKAQPSLGQAPVQVGMQEQWPWPWVLADFSNLHYDLCVKKLQDNAAVYFCDLPESPIVDTRLHEPYWKIQITLRQSREPSVIYLRKDFFPEVPFREGVTLVGVDGEVK